MLVLLIWLLLSIRAAERFDSGIVYEPISYPKNNYNLTIGNLIDANLEGIVDFRNINIYGKLCAIAKYNTGLGKFKTGGTLFMQGTNTLYNDTLTYYEAMQLLQTVLSSKNATIQKELQTVYQSPIASFIGSTSFASFYSVSPFFEDFLIPSVTFADASQVPDVGSIKTIILPSPSLATFSINPTVSPGLFKVIEQFFVQMNWSFVGVIFADGTFGQLGEVYVQKNSDKDPVEQTIIYTCQTTLTNNLTFDDVQLNEFKSCINSLDKVSVVLLWMSIQDAIRVKQYLEQIGAPQWTYVLAYLGANRGNTAFGDPEKNFDLSFYVRNAISPMAVPEILECITETSTPGELNLTNPYSVRDVIKDLYFCDVLNDTQVPFCGGSVEERIQNNCRCDLLVEYNLFNLTVIIFLGGCF